VDAFKQTEAGRKIDFTFKSSPFLLDPSLKNEPIARSERMAQKFGPERVEKIVGFRNLCRRF
jgi:predicted DsbA family dithiol-disulfide isomerase